MKSSPAVAIRAMVATVLILVPLHSLEAQRNGLPPPNQQISQTAPSDHIPHPSHANRVFGVVDGQKLRVDVYEPHKPAAPVPGIILVHGGSWIEFDRTLMDNTASILAHAGFVAFSIDYRLLKIHDHPPRNVWPAQLEDCQLAVRWVRQHAPQYHVDPSKIGAFGHSAGGQLVALLGLTDSHEPTDPNLSSRVQAVVDVSGVTDFTIDHDPDGDSLFAHLFGGTQAQVPAVWRDASPLLRVRPGDPPFLIIHGTWDHDVPIHQSVALADALKKASADVTLVTVDDGHTFQTDAAKLRMMDETIAFFKRTLAR